MLTAVPPAGYHLVLTTRLGLLLAGLRVSPEPAQVFPRPVFSLSPNSLRTQIHVSIRPVRTALQTQVILALLSTGLCGLREAVWLSRYVIIMNQQEEGSMSALRLLLVDDHAEFLEAAASFLAADPRIEIIGRATSGREAVAQVAQLHPDLVFMDIAMPDMDGLEATRRIKAQPGAPSVVVVTLHDGPEYQAAAAAVGTDGFITKADFGVQVRALIDALLTTIHPPDGER